MELSGSEKLVFIISFVLMMNWGVRVAQSIINHALS